MQKRRATDSRRIDTLLDLQRSLWSSLSRFQTVARTGPNISEPPAQVTESTRRILNPTPSPPCSGACGRGGLFPQPAMRIPSRNYRAVEADAAPRPGARSLYHYHKKPVDSQEMSGFDGRLISASAADAVHTFEFTPVDHQTAHYYHEEDWLLRAACLFPSCRFFSTLHRFSR